MSQFARENPELYDDAPSASAVAAGLNAQRLYESLPAVCPDCGNDDAEGLIAGLDWDGKPAWVCRYDEACEDRRAS